MKLNCDVLEFIQRDFNALWKCRPHGDSIEITLPFLLPDSTLLSLYLTQSQNRFIVCDGGDIMEILAEYCSLPEVDALASLRDMASKFEVQEGDIHDVPLFFKGCTDFKLLSSLVFDLANFVMMATSALVTASSEDGGNPKAQRFETQADDFIKSVMPQGLTFSRSDIPEVPGFRFSAVLKSSSRIWLISYVSGSNLTYFRKNVNDTAKSFAHAWSSSIGEHIAGTIPLLNNGAAGYDPVKLDWQIRDLQKDARGNLIRWTEKEQLSPLLNARS